MFAAVSIQVQAALRQWAGTFLATEAGILRHFLLARSLLVYHATAPFEGPGAWNYEVQQPRLLALAFDSARRRLPEILKHLDTSGYPRATRERYYPYRSEALLGGVMDKPGQIYRILHAEQTILARLFAQRQDDEALRRTVSSQLRRMVFAGQKTEELLAIATHR